MLMLLLIVGCSNEADTIPDAHVVYLGGTSQTLFLNENWPASTSEIALTKSVFPDTSTMREEVHTLGYGSYTLITIDYTIAGSTFSGAFADEAGTLNIEGEFLAGEEWGWTEWGSTSTYSDVASCDDPYFCVEEGDYVVSEDKLQESSFTANKWYVRGASDEPIMEITEVLEVLSEADYTALVEELTAR